MSEIQTLEKKSFIPAYDSAAAWERPRATEHVEIDFEALHKSLNKKMKLNAIMEAQSIERAASFRTNS